MLSMINDGSVMRENSASREARKQALLPVLLFIVALSVRLVCAYHLYGFETPQPVFIKYLINAEELRKHDFLPSRAFAYSPLYIYFAALLLSLFHGNIAAIIVAQAVVGAMTSVVVFFIGREVFGRTVGVVASILSIVSLQFLLYDTELLSDALGAFLQSGALLFIIMAARRKNLTPAFVAGAFIGTAALQRPNALLYLFAAAAWFLVSKNGQEGKTVAKKIILSAAGSLVLVAPIMAVNFIGGQDVVPITSSGGYVFFSSNNFQATGAHYNPPRVAINNGTARIGPYVLRDLKYYDDDIISIGIASKVSQKWLKPSEASRFWLHESLEYIRRFPAQFAQLLGRKIVFAVHAFEAHDLQSAREKRKKLSFAVLEGVDRMVLPLGLAGVLLSLRRKECLILHMAWVAQVATLMLFYIVARYRLPLLALSMVYAAYAVVWTVEAVRARYRHEAGSAIGIVSAMTVIAAFFLLCNWPYRFVEEARTAQRSIENLQTALQDANERRDPAGIIPRLQMIIAETPFSFEASAAHILLGDLFKRQGDRERSQYEYAMGQGKHADLKAALTKAWEKDPANVRAGHLLALMLLHEGKARDSAEVLQRAVSAAPANFRLRTLHAQALIAQGPAQYPLAAAELQEALRLGERLETASSLVYFKLALLHRNMGESDKARQYLQKTLFERGYEADAQYMMFSLLEAMGKSGPQEHYNRDFLATYNGPRRLSPSREREIEQRILLSLEGLG